MADINSPSRDSDLSKFQYFSSPDDLSRPDKLYNHGRLTRQTSVLLVFGTHELTTLKISIRLENIRKGEATK